MDTTDADAGGLGNGFSGLLSGSALVGQLLQGLPRFDKSLVARWDRGRPAGIGSTHRVDCKERIKRKCFSCAERKSSAFLSRGGLWMGKSAGGLFPSKIFTVTDCCTINGILIKHFDAFELDAPGGQSDAPVDLTPVSIGLLTTERPIIL